MFHIEPLECHNGNLVRISPFFPISHAVFSLLLDQHVNVRIFVGVADVELFQASHSRRDCDLHMARPVFRQPLDGIFDLGKIRDGLHLIPVS